MIKFLLGSGVVTVLMVASHCVHAGTCSSKVPPVSVQTEAPLPLEGASVILHDEASLQPGIPDVSPEGMSIADFIQNRQVHGLARAILDTECPGPALTQYLMEHRDILMQDLFVQFESKIALDYSRCRPPGTSDVQHVLTLLRSYSVIEMSAGYDAALGVTISASLLAFPWVRRRGSEVEMPACVWEQARSAVWESSFWHEDDTWASVVRVRNSVRGEARRAVPAGLSSLVLNSSMGQSRQYFESQFYQLSELYILSWLTEHGSRYRQQAYQIILDRLPADLDDAVVLPLVSQLTWAHPANEELVKNPFIRMIPVLLDPKYQHMWILRSAQEVSRLGKHSALRHFPRDLTRLLSEMY